MKDLFQLDTVEIQKLEKLLTNSSVADLTLLQEMNSQGCSGCQDVCGDSCSSNCSGDCQGSNYEN